MIFRIGVEDNNDNRIVARALDREIWGRRKVLLRALARKRSTEHIRKLLG